MRTKQKRPRWLKDWKASRPHYRNYSGPEGDGCVGPAEDDGFLERLLDPVIQCLNVEAARKLVRLKAVANA